MPGNEVEIVVSAKDKTKPAFESAIAGSKRVAQEGGRAGDILGGKLKALGVAAVATAGFIAVDLAQKAIGKLIDQASRAVSAASDLGESMNAVDKIFKGSADTVKKWGAEQANAYGLSQRAFQQLATPLGAMLKNQGIAQDKLADTTINLTKRAADLASVFNTDVQDALDALTAGLRGETDPLERYGVSLSAAKVEAEALAMTHKKAAKDLTDAEKAAARLKLIFDQTSDSAGDFRSTSDGLANSTRILAARQEELQAQLGQKLLPIMTKLQQFKLTVLEEVANRAGPLLDNVGDVLGRVYEKARPIFEKAAPMIRQGLADIKQKWEENRESIEKLMPFLEKVGIFLGVTLLAAIGAAVMLIEGMIIWLGKAGDAWQDFERGAQLAMAEILKVAQFIAEALGKIPGPMQQAFKDAAADIERLRNKLMGLDGLEVGIGVNVKLTGLSGLRDAISRAIGSDPVSSGIGHRASGGIASGLTMVAERGAEILDLPQGTMVYPNANTNQMMAQAASAAAPTINVTVQGHVLSDMRLLDVIQQAVSLRGGYGALLGLKDPTERRPYWGT